MLEQECLLRSTLLVCVFICFLVHAVVTAVIPLGSKISVVGNDCWVSSNGDFAVGFFNISNESNQFSVGIRFNAKTIPYSQQTVVWIAGAHVTAGNMSYFQLTAEGELILFDSLEGGGPVWSSGTRNQGVVSASLHDNGNLVLIGREKNIIWQTFSTPSHALLPGQTLSANQTLRAAAKTSMSSFYSLYMNASGELQLRWESNVIYWTGGIPSTSNLTAFLTISGALQLLDQRSKVVWSAFGQDHNDSVNYRFLRLDEDGNLRLYSWVETSQSWRTVWQAVENQCKVFATCGRSGVCVFTASGSTDCVCPFQLTETNTCLVPYGQECGVGFHDIITYRNTHLYGIYPPDDSSIVSSLQQCQQLCLNNSRCTVATFSNNGIPQCSIKETEYVTGYADPSVSSVSFVKRCPDPLAVNPVITNSPPAKLPPINLCVSCLVGAASGTFFVIVILQLGFIFFICHRRKAYTRRNASIALTSSYSKGLTVLSFSEIKSLTGDFENQIGPNVFRGTLPDNSVVAVKELKASIEERKFRSAVLKIGSIHHKNLVKLEGYCSEFNHRFLVFEYAGNGSLDEYIDNNLRCKRLTWRKRVEICLSVAKAVSYLHSGCREFISHGNLKCENVMLDENLDAKVTEFGFTIVDGEAVYCGISAERDVRDFGKLVLTLLTGIRDDAELFELTYKKWIEGNAADLVDKRIEGGIDLEQLECVLRIAFWCLQTDERRRPSMGEVLRMIDGTLSVDPPPAPFTSQRPMLEDDETQDNVSESEIH